MMAAQARGIDERNPSERLTAPPVDDELGRLASSFNGLLGRLAAALNGQRQFMADASHELRTPVSIVRTATQVTLARDSRSEDEYREALTIVGEQAARLSRLVDDMFLLSRAEAQGVPLRREFLHFDDVVADSARGGSSPGGSATRDGDGRRRRRARPSRRRCAAAADGGQSARQRDPPRVPRRRGPPAARTSRAPRDAPPDE